MLRPRARHRAALAGAGRWLSVLALSLPVVSCNVFDRALNVTAPDIIETKNLEQPQNAQLLVNGAIGDFECALGSYVVSAGLASGELMETTQTAARWSLDRRDIDPSETLYSTATCQGLGTYTPLQTARFTAEHALDLLQGWSDSQVTNRQDLIAQAAAYAGYSRLLLGEMYCAAAINGGPQVTSEDLFRGADSLFAIAVTAATAANDAKYLQMAEVGQARARLDLGDKAGALSAAQQVDPSFVITASADVTNDRRQNRVFVENNGRAVSVGEQYRDLTIGGQPDPRVPVVYGNRNASDNRTPWYYQTKYANGSSPIPIASGKEAQLIIAEVQGGQTAVTIINQLRAAAGITTQFASTDPQAIQQEVIEARRRELFLEGQRYYDIRRLDLPQYPAAGTQYSTVYAKGGTYGSERCFPLPDVERLNNPNVGG